ncbi:dihydrofolate reductase family protein [bacterium]|nr:dihydrofolate reductase family protein [bacterium]
MDRPGTRNRRMCQLFIAMSCDGFIARLDGSVDWLQGEGDYGYNDFIDSVDTIIMGSRTYDQVLGFGAWPYEGLRCYVYSRKRAGQQDAHAQFTSMPPDELLADIRREDGKHIWLVGGGEIVRLFMQNNLIDEYHVFIQSVVLGRGLPLFPAGTEEGRLQLVDAHRYDRHIVRLTYLPADAIA